MEKRFDRLEERLDSINDKLSEYNTQLAIHIEGTIQNRKNIAKIEQDMSEIQAHVHQVQGVGKFLTWVAGFVAFVLSTLGVLQLIGVI